MDDEKLMAALTKLSSQIADVKDEVAEFRGEFNAFRSDVRAQFAGVDSQLTQIREDMRVNMASSDIAMDRTRQTRDEVSNLQTQISALHRNQVRLTERVERLERPGKAD